MSPTREKKIIFLSRRLVTRPVALRLKFDPEKRTRRSSGAKETATQPCPPSVHKAMG